MLTAVYVASSADGCSTFTNFVVSDLEFTPAPIWGSRYMGDYIGITSDSQFAYPCWNDNRTGIHQSYVAKVPTNREATVPQVSGHITTNTTWDWMVDLVGDVTVDSGVTLTIKPRARITPKANSDNQHGGADTNLTELIVKGTLAFEADTLSPARRPVFKSSTGEDSSWYGIRMVAGSSITSAKGFRMYHALHDLSLDGFVTIPPDDTLLVNPRWSVTATSSGAAIVVYGTLQFEVDSSDSTRRVLFHSASGARGSWQGIWVYPSGRIESGPGFVITDAVNGVALEAGALGEVRGVRVDNAENAGFWCESDSVQFVHDTVIDVAQGYGVYLDQCDPSVQSCVFDSCEYGVYAFGSASTIRGCKVNGPGVQGIGIYGVPDPDTEPPPLFKYRTTCLRSTEVKGHFTSSHLSVGYRGAGDIDSCTFETNCGDGRSPYGVRSQSESSRVHMRRSQILYYGNTGYYSYKSTSDLGISPDFAGNNQIYTDTAGASIKSVRHTGKTSTDTLKAESNWWGDAAPPSSWFASLVDYTPWLTSPPLGKLAPPVAQEPVAPRANSLLGQNYPNPFNPITTIEFSLPAPGHADLRVYNILGQQVRLLMDEDLPQGTYQVLWNGTDSRGRPVASGMYFYRLETAGFRGSKKMVLLK
jgi:hypothetical protein